jgi:hypothetical protein
VCTTFHSFLSLLRAISNNTMMLCTQQQRLRVMVPTLALIGCLFHVPTPATAQQYTGECQPVSLCSPSANEISPPTLTTDRECTDPAPLLPAWFDDSSYTHTSDLDEEGRHVVHWRLDNETIYFAIDYEATGWVGFGFSPNGNMRQADMIIAWVNATGAYFQDRHIDAFAMPQIDAQQDYTFISGEERAGRTVIEFSRPLNTCDDDDYKLGVGTVKLIWANGDEDPLNENAVMYHGSSPLNRGTRSISLLTNPQTIPDDVSSGSTFDIHMPSVEVRGRTEYICRGVQLPFTNSKQHITGFEAIVNPSNIGRVHHILLYQCYDDLEQEHLDYLGECSGSNMPPILSACRTSALVAGWAVGQPPVYFPEEAGLPISTASTHARYVLMELHYDNPERLAFRDSSGIRLHLTTDTRRHDIGSYSVGVVPSNTMIIPPNQEEYVIRGDCVSQCTKMFDEPINVFSAFPHTHLAGTGVKTRLIRDGVEIDTITDNPSYDFNYQTIELLPKVIEVRRGDEIITECTYRTTGDRVEYLHNLGYTEVKFNESKVVGGEGTIDVRSDRTACC